MFSAGLLDLLSSYCIRGELLVVQFPVLQIALSSNFSGFERVFGLKKAFFISIRNRIGRTVEWMLSVQIGFCR